MTRPPDHVLARCTGCALDFDDLAWARLELVGYQATLDGELLELRNCACGSTLSWLLGPDDFHRGLCYAIERWLRRHPKVRALMIDAGDGGAIRIRTPSGRFVSADGLDAALLRLLEGA